jgi:hypothetical protein
MLLLAALFAVVGVLSWTLLDARAAATPAWRWPQDPSMFAVSGWSVSDQTLETGNGNTYVTRQYRPTDGGTPATVIVTTSQNVKTVYRAGADVPFLGSGYESAALPPEAIAAANGRNVSLLRQGGSGWLQVYAYGETHGQLGNGALGWGVAIFHTVLGQTTDYYLARVLVPSDGTDDVAVARRASQLADVLFPRIATWYAGQPSAAQPDLNRTPIRQSPGLNAPSLG